MSLNLVKMPMICPLDGVNVTPNIAVSVPSDFVDLQLADF
jgi:hypothetical protein